MDVGVFYREFLSAHVAPDGIIAGLLDFDVSILDGET